MQNSFISARLRWIGSVLVCLVLAGTAGLWAKGSYDSVFAYRSPLKNMPPAPGAALSKPLTRQLVFVLIDALRYDTSQNAQVMPVLNRLRQQGVSARMTSRPPSYSQPGYSTLLTGAWPDLNDGPVVNVDGPEIWSFTQDNLFSAAKRVGLESAISGYDWFQRLVPQETLATSFYTSGEDQTADRAVVDAALPWLREARYSLVLIHIDQVDYAGHHEGGPRAEAWNAAASRSDSLLGEILSAVDLNQDTILVCSDHGQIDRGGHGGQDPITLVEPFVLAGQGVRPGAGRDVKMVDVAPTLAVLLGTNLPASAVGKAQLELLKLEDGSGQIVSDAQRKQQDKLLETYRTAIGAPGNLSSTDAARDWRLALERASRLWPVLILAVVWGAVLYWRKPRKWGWLLGGAFSAVAVFHLYYALIEGRTNSLSSVDGIGQLLLTVSVGSIAGFLAGMLVTGLGLGWLNKTALQENSIQIDLFSYLLPLLYLQALPILWSIYRNGWQSTWTLPEMSSAFYGLLSGFQFVVTALVGLLAALGVFVLGRVQAGRLIEVNAGQRMAEEDEKS